MKHFTLSEWYAVQHRSTFFDQQMLNIVATYWNIVVLVEYSFNFWLSTTTHFGAKMKWRTRKCCCRFVLRVLSPLLWSVDKKDSRQHGKLSPELARIYSLVVPSFAAGVFKTTVELFSHRVDISRKPRDKLENDWLKSLHKRQLFDRIRAMLYFRSSTFNNFQHVERHISTFSITWYTVQHLLNSSCKICCLNNNIQATISAVWLAENMSINPKLVNSAISPVLKSEIECKTVKLSAK